MVISAICLFTSFLITLKPHLLLSITEDVSIHEISKLFRIASFLMFSLHKLYSRTCPVKLKNFSNRLICFTCVCLLCIQLPKFILTSTCYLTPSFYQDTVAIKITDTARKNRHCKKLIQFCPVDKSNT